MVIRLMNMHEEWLNRQAGVTGVAYDNMLSPVEKKVSGRMTFRRQKVIRHVTNESPRHEQKYPPNPINPHHEIVIIDDCYRSASLGPV